MGNYNFEALDDKEFERLAVDIIGIAVDARIERFKPGKDQGVDGRWFSSQNREVVIQSKHWVRSGYRSLLGKLRSSEKRKVDQLKPARYLLVTSVELSRRNKQTIRQTLAPHIKSDADVWGREDLEDFLSKHPDLERSHYKLWLSSANVLSHVFNNAVVGRSNFELEEINEKVSLFVKTADYERAQQQLQSRRAIIITGLPGIGKTTLAQQLIIDLAANGFKLVSMRDVRDGESVFSSSERQVFLFDDFLGRNMLEALRLEQDSQIVGFIRRVCRDKDKRFILTSRSSILNQGKEISDLFHLGKTDRNEYEIHVRNLRRLDKARILYSHVWHSGLPDAKLEQIFKNRRYLQIVDHPSFNPRLVEFITDVEFIGSVHTREFWGYVVETLSNPQQLWKHFFGNLSHDCRDLAFLVALNGKALTEESLRTAFGRLREASSNPSQRETATDLALRICVGSVLNRHIDNKTDEAFLSVYNPSITDFVLNSVSDWTSYADFFAALQTQSSLLHLKEIRSSGFMNGAEFSNIVDRMIEVGEPDAKSHFGLKLCEILIEDADASSRHASLLTEVFSDFDVESFGGDERVLLNVLAPAAKLGLLPQPGKAVNAILMRAEEWTLNVEDFSAISDVIEFCTDEEKDGLRQLARKVIVEIFQLTIDDYLAQNDLLDDVFHESQFQGAEHELIESVTARLSETGLRFSDSEIEEVCEVVRMDDIVERNIDWQRDSGENYTPEKNSPVEAPDSVIDDLFERDR